MKREFTDVENTGAPLVPITIEFADNVTDPSADRQFLEEMVWSHRL